MPDEETAFSRQIASKARRKLNAERAGPQNPWFGLGMFGVIGWSVAVPTLLGAMLGVWLDRHYASRHSWTLALLVAGLVIGCANAWHWVSDQTSAIQKGTENTDE
jgi:ATP synthase protein I